MSTLPTHVSTLSTTDIQTYKRLNWVNGGEPSISADNLNKSDTALFNLLNDQGYIKGIIRTINDEIDARKSDILTVNTAVTDEEKKRKEGDSNLNSHIEAHEDDRSNPHYVTKEQVGLSLVDNKSAETLKSEFTGFISFDNPGFVKGGEAYQELQNLKTELKSYADQITPKSVTDLVNDASYMTREAVLMECYTKTQTQEEIQDAIGEIDFPETDLSNYYTKSQTDAQIETAIQNSIPPEVDLSNYYTKSQTNSQIETAIKEIDFPETDLSGYATEEFVTTAISNIEIPEVPTKVSEFENDVGYITEHQSLEGYATEQFVTDIIESIDFPETDLSNYYTKSEVDTNAILIEDEVRLYCGDSTTLISD